MKSIAFKIVMGVVIVALLLLGVIAAADFANDQARRVEAPLPVTGLLDSTNLGFTEAHFYLVSTPDGPVECIVTEPINNVRAGSGISCNWEEAP